MNKFEQKIESLEAASNVCGSVEYYIKDRTEQSEYYTNKAKENAEAEEREIPEDDYWMRQAKKSLVEVNIWEELLAYLEKKYL